MSLRIDCKVSGSRRIKHYTYDLWRVSAPKAVKRMLRPALAARRSDSYVKDPRLIVEVEAGLDSPRLSEFLNAWCEFTTDG
jgi:hypothetical protein